MTGCLDESTLQAHFDDELRADKSAAVIAHLTCCSACSHLADVVKYENQLLHEAIELELTEPIPSDRLRQGLALAIAGRKSISTTRTGFALALGRRLFPGVGPGDFVRAATALILILSTIVIIGSLQRSPIIPIPVAQIESKPSTAATAGEPDAHSITLQQPNEARGLGGSIGPKRFVSQGVTRANRLARHFLHGEGEFVRRVALLTDRIDSDPLMRPALRVEYEHNVALLDGVIEVTRRAARDNSHGTEAARFMLAAYQSKLDFLKQVSDAQHVSFQNE